MKREPKVTCVILAAGASVRFGSPKQLFRLEGNTSLAQLALDTANASKAASVLIVLGHLAEEIQSSLRLGRSKVAYNPSYAQGLSSTVKVGIHNVPKEADAALLMVGDQPFLKSWMLDEMIQHYGQSGKRIVALCQRDELRNPVLFDRSLFPELLALEGDTGAKQVAARHMEEADLINIEEDEAFRDIDSKADLPTA